MSAVPTIHIDLSARCRECGQAGATRSGLCLGCLAEGSRALWAESRRLDDAQRKRNDAHEAWRQRRQQARLDAALSQRRENSRIRSRVVK